VAVGAVVGAVVGFALFVWFLRTARSTGNYDIPEGGNALFYLLGAIGGGIVGAIVGLLL
jgi:hypothetical protein